MYRVEDLQLVHVISLLYANNGTKIMKKKRYHNYYGKTKVQNLKSTYIIINIEVI